MIKYKIVDLFAGAGGLSLGFLSTNKFQITMAVEINKYMKETYIYNHPNVWMEDDIIDVVSNIENIKSNLMDIDLVVGGPPCQGFSNANRQKKSLISSNNQLVKEYVKFIQEIKPRAFVFENVKSITSNKHKFFLGKDDKVLIEKLNLKTKNEEVYIGVSNMITALIDDDVKNNGVRRFGTFLLRNDIYIELNTITKNACKATENIERLKKIITGWDNFHENYYNEEYEKRWNQIRENFLNRSYKECLDKIENIIDAQRVFSKLNELFIHNIKLLDINIKNKKIGINVETYNVYEYLVKSFNNAGYTIDKGILNSVNYGVPQLRERLIIIGIRNELIKETKKEVKLPKSIYTKVEDFTTVYDAIGDLETLETDHEITYIPKMKYRMVNKCPRIYADFVLDSDEIYNHINTKTRQIALDRFKELSEGENFHNLKAEHQSTYANPNKTQNTIYQRLKYNSQSGTVVNVRKSMWVHPKINRAISIREAARLQSFPDSYIFKGTKDAQYQQVGNAVPPLLGKAIAMKILELLE